MNWFVHVDIDAFFASVEQLDNPQYRGLPVIVGGRLNGRRSVVSTASYEARACGVHSAMPIAQAHQLCPDGIYLPVRMKRYHEKSAEVMKIFEEFSPDVHQISVDEAFIDITGTERLFGPPADTAHKIKAAVKEKTGLTVSIGLAVNKYLAKIASGISKPDGFCQIPAGSEAAFMHSLPLDKVWGIGIKTQDRLKKAGLCTTKDIYNVSAQLLCSLIGEAGGLFLYRAVRGQAAALFSEQTKSRSLSAESTYQYDLNDRDAIDTAIMELCYTVMFRMYKENLTGRTVHLKIRYGDFTTCSIQETAPRAVITADGLYTRIRRLFSQKYRGDGIRLLGVGMLNLESAAQGVQQELFDFGENKKQAVERAAMQLKQRNPANNIVKARLLNRRGGNT